MNSSGKFSYAFRKSPLLRAVFALILVMLAVAGIFIFTIRTTPTPEITSINPSMGNPGDLVTIKGKNFGNERDMAYVEFSGNRLTASSYVSWTDDTIKVIIPANIQNGLVVVGNNKHRSSPSFFANENDIPVEVKETVKPTVPVISGLSKSPVAVGESITITGNNFGDTRGSSRVLWTIDYDRELAGNEMPSINLLTNNMIACSDSDYDYESWTNESITVRVPSGVCNGVVMVETSKGCSEPAYVEIRSNYGSKEYTGKKTYLIQYTADISDIVVKGPATITLRCPLPPVSEFQGASENTEIKPLPTLENYHQTLIHQLNVEKNRLFKSTFTQTFVIPVYEVKTTVGASAKSATSYKNMISQGLLTKKTAATEMIPADNESIVELAKKIIGKQKVPYTQAKLVFDYMVAEYKFDTRERKAEADPLDLLRRDRGDAYDFAVFYAALLRSLGIPCMVNSGFLVAQDMTSKTHFWNEIYVVGLGWIPVDVAMACGLEFGTWPDKPSDSNYYFGNLDNHRVTFSYDLNDIKPFAHDSKVVQRPRTFAMQNFWEESTSEVTSYSSYWSDPVVKGIY